MRIVAHTCSNTEIVCALGRADWLVGVDDHSDYPPAVVQGVERVGADLDIDVERVKALKPDLVITSLTVPGHERCLEKLEAAGLPCLVTQPRTLADVAEDIRRIGKVLEAPDQTASLIGEFQRRLDTPPPEHRPVPILVEWWPKPVIVPG
ncbi:MAG: helical backbone metal receptor, partial [Pseudomonadota bacterium]